MSVQAEKARPVKPRIIIHGGAGNISRENLPFESYHAYRNALLDILGAANDLLQRPGAAAVDVAAHAVSLLEDCPLFNSGKGAVFTRAGTHELEASIMVSRNRRKRGVGVMNVRSVKNPILLAKEMLERGDQDDGGGAQGHCQLQGDTCDKLAREWHLDTVSGSYFWTRKRWDEHRRGLGLQHDDETYREHKRLADSCPISLDHRDSSPYDGIVTAPEEFIIHETTGRAQDGDPMWDGEEYLPQGTVGCVVLDSSGTLCVATSTGGLTNKLCGRVGDTPTLGAGFWAEEWSATNTAPSTVSSGILISESGDLAALFSDCLPGLGGYMSLPRSKPSSQPQGLVRSVRAAAMSGTGNGDSFLRLAAVRTAAAMARFSPNSLSLQRAVTAVAGPNGMLQQSAEDRWLKTGEGEGGIIGIEFNGLERQGNVVADFNCGGMFRAWIDDSGRERMRVFREASYECDDT